jgi:prevent-host-death family protein
MSEIGMHEAKTKLSQLVDRAERGEEIVITRNGTPAVRLTPVPKPNRLASVRGVFKGNRSLIDERFDELPDDIAEAFGIKP